MSNSPADIADGVVSDHNQHLTKSRVLQRLWSTLFQSSAKVSNPCLIEAYPLRLAVSVGQKHVHAGLLLIAYQCSVSGETQGLGDLALVEKDLYQPVWD